MRMTEQEFENEKRYGLLMHQAKRMFDAGLISETELFEIEKKYRQKYRPKTGGLLIIKDLICVRKRVMNGVGKEEKDSEDKHC